MDEWILTRLEEIKKRFAEIENLMTKQEVVSNQNEMKKLSKEYRNLEKINKLWDEYTKTSSELEDTKEMINSDDQEISELAKLENETLSKNLDVIFSELANRQLSKALKNIKKPSLADRIVKKRSFQFVEIKWNFKKII